VVRVFSGVFGVKQAFYQSSFMVPLPILTGLFYLYVNGYVSIIDGSTHAPTAWLVLIAQSLHVVAWLVASRMWPKCFRCFRRRKWTRNCCVQTHSRRSASAFPHTDYTTSELMSCRVSSVIVMLHS
jgi:hypothetical protein